MKGIFYILTIVIFVILVIFSIEISYFVYKKIIKNESIESDQMGIDFSAAGLFIPDKEVGYILKPNRSTADLPAWEIRKNIYDKEYHGLGKLISTNSAGYRGKLYTIEKPDNTIRILTLGGSTTWCAFSDDGKTWPDYLQNILSRVIKDKKIEVINGAVGGYTSKQNLEIVRNKFQFYQPDIILVACWFNDMYIRGGNNYFVLPLPATDYHVNNQIKRTDLMKRYPFQGGRVLYRKIRILFDNLKFKLILPPEYRNALNNPTKTFFKKYYSEDRIWIRDYLSNISEIISIARKQQPDAEIFIVAMPSFFVPAKAEEFQEKLALPEHDIVLYHRSYRAKDVESRFYFSLYYHHTILFENFLQDKAKRMRFVLIRGYPAFGKIPFKERNKYFCDEIHLTDDGNNLLAKEVASQLLTMSTTLINITKR